MKYSQTYPLYRRCVNFLRDIRYNVRCLIWPHNVVRVQALERGWCDRDELMLHVIFQVLVDFVELEKPFMDFDHSYSYRKRYTDRDAMRAWIEKNYNTQEGRESFHWPSITAEEKQRQDATTEKTYHINSEILYLYEWYKDKRYEFDILRYSWMTGEKIIFNEAGRMERVPNGKQQLITNKELLELGDEHRVVVNNMLKRVLAVRSHLWT